MNSLMFYNEACRALEQCTSAVEVEDIINKAEALRVYAKMAKDLTLEIKAAKLRIEAERKLGQMLAQAKQQGMLKTKGGQRKNESSDDELSLKPASLAQIGVDKKTAARSQKYAAMPDAAFSEAVKQWEEKSVNDGRTAKVLPCAAETPRKKAPVIEYKEEAEVAEFESSDDERSSTDETFQSLYEQEAAENAEKGEKITVLEERLAAALAENAALKANAKEAVSAEAAQEIAALKAKNEALERALKAVEVTRDHLMQESAAYLRKGKYWKKYALELEATYNHQRPQKTSTYCTGSGYSDPNDPRHIEWVKQQAMAAQMAQEKAAANAQKKEAHQWLAQNNLPADEGYQFSGKPAAAQATREKFADKRPKEEPASEEPQKKIDWAAMGRHHGNHEAQRRMLTAAELYDYYNPPPGEAINGWGDLAK